METKIVQTPSAELFVKVFNPGKAETLIMLHGGPGVPDYLDEVALMAENYFRIISFDQRGVGQSKALNNSYAVKDYISDINAVAAHFNSESFHLFGHSWGGLLAQLYSKEFPEKIKSLFLSNPAPGVGKHWMLMVWEELKRALKKTNPKELIKLKLNFLKSLAGGKRADEAYEYIFTTTWRYFFKHPATAPVDKNLYRGIRARAVNATFMELLKMDSSDLEKIKLPLTTPVAVLHGSDDFLKKSRKVVLKRFPGAEKTELTGTGHVPWLQDKAQYRQALLGFYDSLEKS